MKDFCNVCSIGSSELTSPANCCTSEASHPSRTLWPICARLIELKSVFPAAMSPASRCAVFSMRPIIPGPILLDTPAYVLSCAKRSHVRSSNASCSAAATKATCSGEEESGTAHTAA